MRSSVTGFIHSAECFQGLFMLQHVPEFNTLIWPIIILHCICTPQVFIHSSVGHLSCLCIVAIVNNSVMKHLGIPFLSGCFHFSWSDFYFARSKGVGRSCSNSRFNFWSTAKLFFTITVPYTFPPAMCWGFQFPCILLSTCYCLCFFYYSHAGGCEVVCHYGFDLHFLNN